MLEEDLGDAWGREEGGGAEGRTKKGGGLTREVLAMCRSLSQVLYQGGGGVMEVMGG